MTEQNESVVLPSTLDDLKGRTPEELRNMIEVLDAHLKDLHQNEDGELRDLSPDEDAAFKTGLEIRERAMAMLEHHRNVSEIFRKRPESVKRVYANLRAGLDEPGDIRRMTNGEARDRALRHLDSRDAAGHLSPASKDYVEKQVRVDTHIARRILVTENEDYRNAWMKCVTRLHPILTPEETRAMQEWEEFRAMSEGTNSAGGYGIPVKLAA